MSRSFLEASIPDLVQKLTIDEKISLLGAPNWWNTTPIDRLEIPSVRMSDGPNVRYIPFKSSSFPELLAAGRQRVFPLCIHPRSMHSSKSSLCAPRLHRHTHSHAYSQCATSLASTFDPELVYKVGQFLGQEAKVKSSVILLAPTCNIQRSPLGGRAFESFSEDPYLSGMNLLLLWACLT